MTSSSMEILTLSEELQINEKLEQNRFSKDKDKAIMEPFYYLSEIQTTTRSLIVDLCNNEWFHIPSEDCDKIKKLYNMLHIAILLIQDIEDDAQLRRGVPVAHKIFGVPLTLNCANIVFFNAMASVQDFGSQSTDLFIQELKRFHVGQFKNLYWRDTNRCPTEQEYISSIVERNGSLMHLAIRLMKIKSKNLISHEKFIPLLNALSIYLQLRDDNNNLQEPKDDKNKYFCEDMTEGKFTFPIIHSISSSEDSRLLQIIKSRTKDEDVKRYAISFLKAKGSFEYTKKVMFEQKKIIEVELQKLGGSTQFLQLLH